YSLYAKTIVNATGPWSDAVRALDHSLEGKKVFLTKGVHLVCDRARFPVSQAVYFDSPDGRMIFVIPRQQVTYFGTTDTPYTEEIGQQHTTTEDRDYLLAAVNRLFPLLQLVPEDVIATWAGLRPLVYEEGKGPSELSRKEEIFHSSSGLMTIAGGKLTGFRKMAEKVVDLLADTLQENSDQQFAECQTDRAPISSGAYSDTLTFSDWHSEIKSQASEQGMTREQLDELVSLYGSNVERIIQIADEVQSDDAEYKRWSAQIRYSVQEEMAVTAVDVLLRRTGYLYFRLKEAQRMAPLVVEIMSKMLGWTALDADEQLKQVQQEISSMTILPEENKKTMK
ncbi:MAG: Glycerol-3-phosphate dehydrogenase, partial [Bacilli bacterium]|nr:Glycerol-3-phosphate dehydrogenase [Bacilli bacterium]